MGSFFLTPVLPGRAKRPTGPPSRAERPILEKPASPAARPQLLFVHQASFLMWLAAMALQVLWHLQETARLAPLDLARRTRSQVAGASARQWAVIASLAVGVVLGLVMLSTTAHYLGATVGFIHHHRHH